MFLETYNTEFDVFIITFTDQNDKLSEIEDKVNLILLLINRNGTMFYRTKIKKIQQRICIFALWENHIQKIWEKLLNIATKTRLNAAKTASKK